MVGRRNWLGGAAGGLWLLVVMVPIYWILITSFKAQSGVFSASDIQEMAKRLADFIALP